MSTDTSRGSTETRWQHLNRSHDPRHVATLRRWKEWLQAYPSAEAAQHLRGNLESDSDAQVDQGLTELFTHAVLTACTGDPVEVEPIIEGTSRPDFRIREGGHPIYLEATRLSPRKPAQTHDRRLAQLIEGLNQLPINDFSLLLHARLDGAQPPKGPLHKELREWLSTLDWTSERQKLEMDPRSPRPTRLLPAGEGNVVWVEALPLAEVQRSGGLPTVGVVEYGRPFNVTFTELLQTIKKKVRQHRPVATSSVVVVDITETMLRPDEVAAALYGPLVASSSDPMKSTRHRSQCLWPTQDASPAPLAVLIIDDLRAGAEQSAQLNLWLRPDMHNTPLPAGPWTVSQLGAPPEQVDTQPPTTSLAELLS